MTVVQPHVPLVVSLAHAGDIGETPWQVPPCVSTCTNVQSAARNVLSEKTGTVAAQGMAASNKASDTPVRAGFMNPTFPTQPEGPGTSYLAGNAPIPQACPPRWSTHLGRAWRDGNVWVEKGVREQRGSIYTCSALERPEPLGTFSRSCAGRRGAQSSS